MTTITDEIKQRAEELCQQHCGHDGTYSCHVCEGKHQELCIKIATEFYEKRGFDILKQLKETCYDSQYNYCEARFSLYDIEKLINPPTPKTKEEENL